MLKKFFKKIPNGLEGLVIVAIVIVISLVITGLVYYKAPISLSSNDDRAKIETMLKMQHPNDSIVNMVLLENQIVLPHMDSTIYEKCDNINSISDILWYTRTVTYDVIKEGDTIKYLTTFEMVESFLKENVGQHLYTIER
jgi:hypothetical protein